jgi:hypothetical protein
MVVSFRIVTREWLGLALCNALELSIYGFFSYHSCCFARDRRRPSVIERGRYAEDMYATAFIPGGIRAESSREFTFSRRSRFIPVALSVLPVPALGRLRWAAAD